MPRKQNKIKSPNQTSITDFSHIPKANIVNINGELTPVKVRNLFLTELRNDIRLIVQNEIKKHLKIETSKSDQSVTLGAETFACRNFREIKKSRNF